MWKNCEPVNSKFLQSKLLQNKPFDDTLEFTAKIVISNEVKKIRSEDFEEQSKSSETQKLFEQEQSGADKVVTTLSKKTTKITNSSEIATKTEQEERAKTTASSVDTGSKASIIVVSRGAREGQTFILIQKIWREVTVGSAKSHP